MSKITGVATQLGLSFSTANSCKQALEYLTNESRQLILIDLNLPHLDWELLDSILNSESPLVSIAFGPHVDTEQFKKAKTAGCSQILPRSQFSAQLPQLLQAALEREP
ncbi:response regulator [uncultured Gimesia sp.]|uniref:response regulator n=1 Tax=uncultured Gimesia sp. TaxID=1678688 RepID=UPI0026060B19|nr:response regulator [uncultured Gimesia sp.]